MTGRDASRPAPATAPARRRGDRIVAVAGNAADLPPVTEAQLATLRYLGQVAGLAHRRELRRDTLATLVRAGLVGCRGPYRVEITALGLRLLVCATARAPASTRQSRRAARRRAW